MAVGTGLEQALGPLKQCHPSGSVLAPWTRAVGAPNTHNSSQWLQLLVTIF